MFCSVQSSTVYFIWHSTFIYSSIWSLLWDRHGLQMYRYVETFLHSFFVWLTIASKYNRYFFSLIFYTVHSKVYIENGKPIWKRNSTQFIFKVSSWCLVFDFYFIVCFALFFCISFFDMHAFVHGDQSSFILTVIFSISFCLMHMF